MLLGLVSDTHDNVPLCEVVAAFFRERGVETIFHLGDVTGPEALEPFGEAPMIVVRGNNDDELPRIPETWTQTFAGVTVGATHGHHRGHLRRLASEVDVLLHGHTHVRKLAREGRCLVVNPGALYRTATRTCALLELPAKRVVFYRVEEDGVRRL